MAKRKLKALPTQEERIIARLKAYGLHEATPAEKKKYKHLAKWPDCYDEK